VLRENQNGGADFSPVEKPFGIFDTHVDTAVAGRVTEIIVPGCSVEAVTLVKIHGPGDIGDVVAWASHAGGFKLDVDLIIAGDGGGGCLASGDDKLGMGENTIFKGIYSLS